jgi:Protein of unknown function (DUF1499)
MPQSQPPSKLLSWSVYLGATFMLALPLSVAIVRSGAWQQGLLLYGLACLGATALFAALAVMLLLPRYSAQRGAIAKQGLLVIPGVILFISLMASRGDTPPIHDITTDLIDPPVFTAAPKERGQSNSLTIDPNNLMLQKQSYPELGSLRNSQPAQENFSRAQAIAREMGWRIYHADIDAGVIEAVDTTALMAFKDDVIIRVREQAGETLIDLRSVSRVGQSDFGANAERIRQFQRKFQP